MPANSVSGTQSDEGRERERGGGGGWKESGGERMRGMEREGERQIEKSEWGTRRGTGREMEMQGDERDCYVLIA